MAVKVCDVCMYLCTAFCRYINYLITRASQTIQRIEFGIFHQINLICNLICYANVITSIVLCVQLLYKINSLLRWGHSYGQVAWNVISSVLS